MTTALAAFIPAQRPASDPAPAAPVVAPVPGPRVPDAAVHPVREVEAVLPQTPAQRRAYARQIVADAYYDLYSDVFGTSPEPPTTREGI